MQASPRTHRQLQSSSHASAQTQVQPLRVHHGRRLSHIISVPVTLKCDDEDDPNGNDNNRTGLPHYFPSLTPRYVQVSGQHASQRRGTHFPTLLFLPPGKIRMVHRPLPTTPWSFSSGAFCGYRAATNICSYPEWLHGLSNKKTRKQRIPRLN